MSDSQSSTVDASSDTTELVSPFRLLFKLILAGNPFYLASAGLLLYGINELTTDPKLVGAEFPMLRFNFCALLLYEIMLVGTAIALFRRKIWYDALLLFGLTNLFIIVPFSLISRAVFLSDHLARMMCLLGALLAVAKFWAFKRYAPELNLSRRLLAFGAALLLVNTCAPLLFKSIANDQDLIANRFSVVWLYLLPMLAGLSLLLPRQAVSGESPGQKRWLPMAVFFAWVAVTACHFGGIGYSTSYVWDYSLLVPVAWVASWILYLRITDFAIAPGRRVINAVLSVPVLVPLLAVGSERILFVFAGLNLAGFTVLFLRGQGRFGALVRLLGAVAIFLGGLPAGWSGHIVPGIARPEWVGISVFVCFFWLIFRSRDPRVALFAALGLLGFSLCFIPDFLRYAFQVALVSLLVHSLRWDDQACRGASVLRILACTLWLLVSCVWLVESTQSVRWLVDSAATLLLIAWLLRLVIFRNYRHWLVFVSATVVLLSEPALFVTLWLGNQSAGMEAIVASFLLFALGSVAAFSKPKWWRSG